MVGFQNEEEYYRKIQKQLFEMIPETWKTILLHTAIIDIPGYKPRAEMYLYYLPKGILKRKPVNCYEIPKLFDIDEEEYSRLITNLYNTLKLLRDSYRKSKGKKWSTINIACFVDKFDVEYGFEDLRNSQFTLEERHLIWRYENLDIDIDTLSRRERKFLKEYIDDSRLRFAPKVESCRVPIYEKPVKAVVDYEKSLTIDELVARDTEKKRVEEKEKKKLEKKRRKRQLDILEDETETIINNQILK